MKHKSQFCWRSPGVYVCAGIFWNLSSKDNLKEKLAREILPELTDKILIPLSGSRDSDNIIQQSPSEAEIFYNTTGCLRCTSLIRVFSLWSQHASSAFGSAMFVFTLEGFNLQINFHLGDICNTPCMIFIMPLYNIGLYNCTAISVSTIWSK